MDTRGKLTNACMVRLDDELATRLDSLRPRGVSRPEQIRQLIEEQLQARGVPGAPASTIRSR